MIIRITSSPHFFGEIACLFPPTRAFRDEDGNLLNGHRRTRSAYCRNREVVLGVLDYETLLELRRERHQISETVVPYANMIREGVVAASPRGTQLPEASMLDCYPQMKQLNARLVRIEAMLSLIAPADDGGGNATSSSPSSLPSTPEAKDG